MFGIICDYALFVERIVSDDDIVLWCDDGA